MASEAVQKGEAFDTNYTGTIETGSVELTELNEDVAAEGTAEKLEEVKAGLQDGSIHVFDTSTFTVDGKAVDSSNVPADTTYADFDPANAEALVADGYYHESEFRSAPYFDLNIDGINLLDTKF
jgi:basic membrane protein A